MSSIISIVLIDDYDETTIKLQLIYPIQSNLISEIQVKLLSLEIIFTLFDCFSKSQKAKIT